MLDPGSGRADPRQVRKCSHDRIFRTSTIFPSIAAAAAITGLIKWVRPPRPCLPSKFRFDVGRTAFTRLQAIGIHCKTHRAAGLSPQKACVRKNTIEPFALCLSLNRSRSGHNHCTYPAGRVPTLYNGCSSTQILDSSVGAGPINTRSIGTPSMGDPALSPI